MSVHKKHDDVCQVRTVDEDRVRSTRQVLIGDDEAARLSETFRVLADPSRIKIIHALSQEELCVCDIAAILGTSISAVSHQLRVLRNMRLVRFRKEAKMVYYSLDDDHIRKLFQEGLTHLRE